MTRDQKIIAVLVGILALGGILLLAIHNSDQADIAAAQAETKAQQAINADLTQQIKDRDTADKTQRAQAQAQESQVKTSADAAKVIGGIAVDGPFVTSGDESIQGSTAPAFPDAPSYVLQTQDEAVATAKKIIQCNADEVSLLTCKADLADETKIAAGTQQEVYTWEKAAKGGTTATRFLKIAGCSLAAGGGATLGAAFWHAKGAAIGAIGGAGTCMVVW